MEVQLIVKAKGVKADLFGFAQLKDDDVQKIAFVNLERATLQVVYDVSEFMKFHGETNSADLFVEGEKVDVADVSILNGKIYLHFAQLKIIGYEKGLNRVAYVKTGQLLSVFEFPYRLEQVFEELVT